MKREDDLTWPRVEPRLAAVVPPGVGGNAIAWALAAAIITDCLTADPAAADEVIRPCRPGTPAHDAARQALDGLDGDIRKLAPGADPAPLGRRVRSLGEQACFRIRGGLDVDAKSGLALRTWWEDGGQSAVAAALSLGGKEPYVWVAPDVRRALTRETSPGHRLSSLLCPADDRSWGRETDGWRLRAEAALERAARVRNLESEGIRETLVDGKRRERCAGVPS